MAVRKKTGRRKTPAATNGAAKPKKRQLKPFPERQINAGKAFEAACDLFEVEHGHAFISDFERAYAARSDRPKAKLNDPEFLRQQYLRVTGQEMPEDPTIPPIGSVDASNTMTEES